MIAATTMRIDYLDKEDKAYCNCSYLHFFHRHNISLLMITDFQNIDTIVETCDMLLLGGGYDIHPEFYHKSAQQNYNHYHEEVDLLDYVLLKAFYKAHKPVLGICRGMQMINVFFHGTLFTDIKHHTHKEHELLFSPNSILKSYYSPHYKCNSFHHQAIDKLGDGLLIDAITKDGIIEAISFADFIIGLQWHPEKMKNDPILLYFLTYANKISTENTQA